MSQSRPLPNVPSQMGILTRLYSYICSEKLPQNKSDPEASSPLPSSLSEQSHQLEHVKQSRSHWFWLKHQYPKSGRLDTIVMIHITPNWAGAEPQQHSLAEKGWDNVRAQDPHQDCFGFSLSTRQQGLEISRNVPKAILALRLASVGWLCPHY